MTDELPEPTDDQLYNAYGFEGGIRYTPEPDDCDPDCDPRERHGFGVCLRGTCVEPCGPHGGCIR